MRRQVIFDLEARLEFEDAIEWYDEHKAGLGGRFQAEIKATLQRILEDPERFRFSGRTIRKARVETFDKYNIHFRIQSDFIVHGRLGYHARCPNPSLGNHITISSAVE